MNKNQRTGIGSKNKTKMLALSSCFVALGVTLMYFGAITNVLDLTMVAVTSVAVYFAVIEMGGYYPYMIYAATTVLALILLPDKFSAIAYMAFGGIYPILKEKFERRKKPVCIFLKFLFFNIAGVAIILVSIFILNFSTEDGIPYYIATLALANVAFLLYDIAMTRMITLYLFKFRQMLKVDKFFK